VRLEAELVEVGGREVLVELYGGSQICAPCRVRIPTASVTPFGLIPLACVTWSLKAARVVFGCCENGHPRPQGSPAPSGRVTPNAGALRLLVLSDV
jgi:hypothetical protein